MRACLGTDAMRDGVDVPGRALRLVVFERVPWPGRISCIGSGGYISRAGTRLGMTIGSRGAAASGIWAPDPCGRGPGVFVLLDRRMPGRLLSAFPRGVVPQRVGLAEAVAGTAAYLKE